MTKLLMLKGLPGSGKSTYAKTLVENDSTWRRINKDDLRTMLTSGKWSGKDETVVLATRNGLLEKYILAGYNVVIDDTNLHPKHEQYLDQFAKDYHIEFEIKFFDTPLVECLNRDKKRANPVGQRVIMDMFNRYLKPVTSSIKTLTQFCIICDLDGTLAEFDGNPYDRDFSQDKVNQAVRDILYTYGNSGHPVSLILTSGRSDKYREVTEKWLADNHIQYEELYMRSETDYRKDRIVKKEIYDNYIKGKYNVLFCIDDRDQVVSLWRELGLTCFQVNYGDF